MITEKGEVTARDCLSQSELGNFEGPSVSASVCNMSAGPCLDETMSGPFMTIRRSRTSVPRHSLLVCDNSPNKVQSSYKPQVQTVRPTLL
jgi:hypothetical protein